MIDEIYNWFAGTSDFWGIVIGSAVGVVFGYLASVAHQWWVAKRERQNVRALIRQEYLLNQDSLGRLESELTGKWQCRSFAYGSRPYWSRTGLSAHLQRFPDVLSEDEAKKVLGFYHGLEGISAIWQRLHSALVIDLSAPRTVEHEFGVSGRTVTPHFSHEFEKTVEQVWPELKTLILTLNQYPKSILV